MSKNTKKKNAIRFGALAVAALLFLGVFSAWALSTQATATAGIGDVEVDGLTVEAGEDANNELLEDSVAGRPGTVNASDSEPFRLYQFGNDTDEVLDANYTAIVYLVNGADLVDAGMRYMTLDMQLNDTTDGAVDNGTLTLENGKAAFTFNPETYGAENLTIDIVGGSYGSHPFADFTDLNEVRFVIDVEPGQPELND